MLLYGHPISSCSRRVLVTAAHLGVKLELRPIDLASTADRAALLAVNPNTKIPVLVDGDYVLWESHAIMQYVCERTPDQTLHPRELRARIDVDRWLFWTSHHLAPVVGPINFERMWKRFVAGPDAQPDQHLIDHYERFFQQSAAVLDQHLAARRWLANDRLSLADISVAATLMYARPTKLPLDAYPHVLALVGRVQALEAWQATEAARIS